MRSALGAGVGGVQHFHLPFPSFRLANYSFNSCSPHKRTPSVGFLRCPAMATLVSAPVVQVKERIELTVTERNIFDRLLGTLCHFGLSNQLRVAGGWVRDKVSG